MAGNYAYQGDTQLVWEDTLLVGNYYANSLGEARKPEAKRREMARIKMDYSRKAKVTQANKDDPGEKA